MQELRRNLSNLLSIFQVPIQRCFKAAKKQGCKVVEIDLDENIMDVKPFELSKYISRRKNDFVCGLIQACYVVFNGEAIVVNAKQQTRKEIESIINELKP